MDEPRPDLIIAIDFGMTCTGVAYANPSVGSDTIRWIQRWPGRMQANENKVPTILVYPTNQLTPSSWGFQSETDTERQAENKEHQEWFKTYLDEERLREVQMIAKDPSDVPSSIEVVERWYHDYFVFLYQYIESKLQMELPSRWEDARIEFIFSVPTTWKPHPTVERFRSITERAGFGRYPNHKSIIGLTEAEAAAVHMSRESPAIFKENDILIVCDAGGGTTDLSALRVQGTGGGRSLTLQQLDVVFGANLGSAQIDHAFELSVQERLEMANRVIPLGIEIEDAAWEMMKSKEYQNAKCDYGSPDDTDFFSVAIPKLSKSYRLESSGILDGELRIRRDELQALFDIQIVKLFELIDKQLQRIQSRLPSEQVAHLVLSGGLGNSAYIQKRLRARYAFGASSFHNAANLQVRVAPDPQLVVCKGIVADRLQKLRGGQSVLGWRCCRASYGTICKVPYNPNNSLHFGQKTHRDAVDGKVYVSDVVDWFIKQGEPVSVDYPIVRTFTRKISFGNPYRVFPVGVVVSHLDKDLLPYTMNQNCSTLCNVQSDFSTVELSRFKLKNRHFWNMGEKYYRVEYLIKVALGPADIRFELWFNGQKLSKDEPIRVEWQAAAAPALSPPAPAVNNPLHMQQQMSMSPTHQNWDTKNQNISYNHTPQNHSPYAVY
ncbi:hypothetical protein BKA65DRAFT_598749 [Rhexocercosporidium sp. MPI-PUGE-AT-0058]|nr:hypothetical protein BKA65DRAFT_598749 [Rhexocercosporidium sp. MPI-PUGE-AT-0058]